MQAILGQAAYLSGGGSHNDELSDSLLANAMQDLVVANQSGIMADPQYAVGSQDFTEVKSKQKARLAKKEGDAASSSEQQQQQQQQHSGGNKKDGNNKSLKEPKNKPILFI